tara:strand:+ start:546 stop:1832 length:1287 start_codon:yes stop_codon:yes gene_type:complete
MLKRSDTSRLKNKSFSQRFNSFSKLFIIVTLIAVASLFVSSAGVTFQDGALITNDLSIDSGTFYVDSANNKVGIGRMDPEFSIDSRKIGKRAFRIGNANGGDFTIDVGGGQGLVSLVGGAKIDTVNGGYVYTGTRGASKIQLNDNGVLFYVADTTPGVAGQAVAGLNNGQQKMFLRNTGELEVKNGVKSPKYCIGEDCITSWPTGGSSIIPYGETDIIMEAPSLTYTRGTSVRDKTGLVFRSMTNPNGPIFQVQSSGRAVRFFVEHTGYTGAVSNSAWFGGNLPNYFNGNMGIGVEKPTQKLEVDGRIKIIKGWRGIQIHGENDAPHRYDFVVGCVGGGTTCNDGTAGNNPREGGFGIYDDTAKAYRFAIANDGKIGIGTTNPKAKLEVIGNVKISSISGDGKDMVVCINSVGDLGTCDISGGSCSCE